MPLLVIPSEREVLLTDLRLCRERELKTNLVEDKMEVTARLVEKVALKDLWQVDLHEADIIAVKKNHAFVANRLEKPVMPKIAEEKLMLQWKESKMIGGEPVYYLDESHAVCIKDYIDQVEIWFFERTQENGKYYCRVTKKHFLDARKIKENYEILLNA